MDYGKIAYLKVQDLERQTAQSNQGVAFNALNLAPRAVLYHDFKLANIKGSGEALLIVKLRVQNFNGMQLQRQAEAVLTLGSMTVYKAALSFTAAAPVATLDAVIPIGLDGESVLRLKAIDMCKLIGAEIACVGASMVKSGEMSGDGQRDSFAVLTCLYNDCTLYQLTPENELVPQFFDYAISCDILKTEDGYVAVTCDEYGNLNGYVLNSNLMVEKAVRLGDGGDSVALTFDGSRLLFAVVSGQKVFTFYADKTLSGISARTELLHSAGAQSVRFVKNTVEPYLIINTATHAQLRCGVKSFALETCIVNSGKTVLTAV